MKLTYEDKVRIYELRKQGISLKRLSEKYGMNLSKFLTSQPLSKTLLITAQTIKKNQPVLTDFRFIIKQGLFWRYQNLDLRLVLSQLDKAFLHNIL